MKTATWAFVALAYGQKSGRSAEPWVGRQPLVIPRAAIASIASNAGLSGGTSSNVWLRTFTVMHCCADRAHTSNAFAQICAGPFVGAGPRACPNAAAVGGKGGHGGPPLRPMVSHWQV
jgi:hypothetical protein